MAAMIFKRTVFETRKKPKGLLRPKIRANLKEVAQVCIPAEKVSNLQMAALISKSVGMTEES